MSDAKMGHASVYGEPWTVYEGEAGGRRYFLQGSDAPTEFGRIIAGQDFRGDNHLPPDEVRRRMRRAARCVNACAGMEDPAKEIARLRRIEEFMRVLADAFDVAGEGGIRPTTITLTDAVIDAILNKNRELYEALADD